MVTQMDEFQKLVDRSTSYTLLQLDKIQEHLFAELEGSSSTVAVKNLQMIEIQKTIMAVGMFSIFEAKIQDYLGSNYGFKALRRLLEINHEDSLLVRFNWYALAVNVLKHGRGSSYDALLANVDQLPFRVKRPDEFFISEGDMSEIDTLVHVDNSFVLGCAEVIRDVCAFVQRTDQKSI
jgi:hypothetical protein